MPPARLSALTRIPATSITASSTAAAAAHRSRRAGAPPTPTQQLSTCRRRRRLLRRHDGSHGFATAAVATRRSTIERCFEWRRHRAGHVCDCHQQQRRGRRFLRRRRWFHGFVYTGSLTSIDPGAFTTIDDPNTVSGGVDLGQGTFVTAINSSAWSAATTMTLARQLRLHRHPGGQWHLQLTPMSSIRMAPTAPRFWASTPPARSSATILNANHQLQGFVESNGI